ARLQGQASQALRGGNVGDAINYYKRALDLQPDNTDMLRGLQIAQAIQENKQAYYNAINQGTAAMLQGRYIDAVAAFTAALQLAPGDPYSIDNLNRAQAALVALQQVHNRYDNLIAQAQAALATKRWSDASKLLREALAVSRPPLVQDPQVRRLADYADLMA